jgi:hypothetical protein
MRLRTLVVLVVLAVVVGVGVATLRDGVSLPSLRGCTTELDGLTVELSGEQTENAALIAAIGVQRELPARAVSIALATAYQESKIVNIDYGDRDSLGLFQQRPSQGWGSEAQVQDAVYATNAFYDALEQVEDYQSLRITEAAQTVQRSGFPEAYEDHAEDARALASVLTGYSPGGLISCTTPDPDGSGSVGRTSDTLLEAYGDLDVARTGRTLSVGVDGSDAGRRLGWSVAAFTVAHAERLGVASVTHDGRRWRAGRGADDAWTDVDNPDARAVRITLG